MRRILSAAFFRRPTLAVARDLLGKHLVRRRGGHVEAFMITDVEAYDGPHDLASHAARGLTRRNAPMFGPAGRWYVYLCYGMHWMLNVVTGPTDYPAAVLIRGVAEIDGPARVTKRLGVDRSFDGRVAGRATGLHVEDRGERAPRSRVLRLPRVGVAYAGAWAHKPYRFVLKPLSTRPLQPRAK